jgi:putative endopeptidase
VNASYSQTANTLIVPAGRLQPPLFDPNGSDESNFGGVGTLIGHEMGHAIDNQGSQYDRLGNIRDWWAPSDHEVFEQRTARLVQQYAKYEAMPGERINGAATLSENIADLVGLAVAYDALSARLAGRLSREIEQKFFTAWAQRWHAKYSQALLLRVIKSDTHAPNQFRCSGPLWNFRPFFDAFDIDPPQHLISIW